MIDFTTLASFTLLNMGFALIPGPDVLCILTNAIARGARAGVMVCLGIGSACLVHVAAASLGLTALLMLVPAAFVMVKTLGAIYLVWLGWQMLRHPVSPLAEVPRSAWSSPFMQGALSNLLNPKIAIFFLAILPQFVHPESGNPGTQTLVLGLVSVVSGTAVNLCTALLGARARRVLMDRQRLFQRFQQLAGATLIALGFRVALDRAR